MKIGIVSDTHTNKEYLEKAVRWLVDKQHISSLYHLGDDCEDAIGLSDEGIDVVQVPGIYDPKYRDGSLPAKAIENVMGVQIMLVHSIDKDVGAQDKKVCDIILHGHTHKPEIVLADGLLVMNPGHLKGPLDKNTEPSFGMLDIASKEVNAVIYNLKFKEIQSMHMVRSETGLFKG